MGSSHRGGTNGQAARRAARVDHREDTRVSRDSRAASRTNESRVAAKPDAVCGHARRGGARVARPVSRRVWSRASRATAVASPRVVSRFACHGCRVASRVAVVAARAVSSFDRHPPHTRSLTLPPSRVLRALPPPHAIASPSPPARDRSGHCARRSSRAAAIARIGERRMKRSAAAARPTAPPPPAAAAAAAATRAALATRASSARSVPPTNEERFQKRRYSSLC